MLDRLHVTFGKDMGHQLSEPRRLRILHLHKVHPTTHLMKWLSCLCTRSVPLETLRITSAPRGSAALLNRLLARVGPTLKHLELDNCSGTG